MGVPAFYKWLSIKYPAVVKDVTETRLITASSYDQATNEEQQTTEPSCGSVDNLYIDMNGIIHPCCHPEDGLTPNSEDEMFLRIFSYVDRIMSLVQPKNLLYLAVDGVAPRAKMNQQRSRRFKTAAEVEQENRDYAELKAKFESEGRSFPAKKLHWDSNVITPGTPFLCKLSKALYYFVNDRMASNSLWFDLKVIISDANCPGEGEHKIMHFIRTQRTFENYDPNLHHCIHGADADLIMLGLATHEPYFYILRESVLEKNSLPGCFLCGQKTHLAADCPNDPNTLKTTPEDAGDFQSSWKPLQLLSLSVLREYLAYEFSFKDCTTFQPNLERCIDDFVLLCFFVGNDFLPHLPSLSIHKGSIDQMILLYQKLRPTLSDYLTNEGVLNLQQLKSFVYYLGVVEKDVFIADLKWKERNQQRRNESQASEQNVADSNVTDTVHVKNDPNHLALQQLKRSFKKGEIDTMESENILDGVGVSNHEKNIDLFKALMRNRRKAATEIVNPVDNIKLGYGQEDLYKLRYYQQKFNTTCDNIEALTPFVKTLAVYYVEGLRWVLAYYYQGVSSWEWFFPFHYAPFASEVAAYGTENQKPFVLGKPFKPFEQLMAVLPPQSRLCLPEAYSALMTEDDSPLLDFYPLQFKEDPDGKRYKWQWVVLLPFIDQERLLKTLQPLESALTQEEKDRNCESSDCLVISKRHIEKFEKQLTHDSSSKSSMINWSPTTSLGGEVSRKSLFFVNETSIWAPDCSHEDFPVQACHIVCFDFRCAPFFAHVSCLLPNTLIPPPQLKQHQLESDFNNNNRGCRFNSQGAKRMIIGCLGRFGMVSRAEADSYFFSSHSNRQMFQQYRSDNPYQQEMFPQNERMCNLNTIQEVPARFTSASHSFRPRAILTGHTRPSYNMENIEGHTFNLYADHRSKDIHEKTTLRPPQNPQVEHPVHFARGPRPSCQPQHNHRPYVPRTKVLRVEEQQLPLYPEWINATRPSREMYLGKRSRVWQQPQDSRPAMARGTLYHPRRSHFYN